jgi:hypothetical protein
LAAAYLESDINTSARDRLLKRFLEALEASLRCLLGELAGIDAELLEQLRVLLVVDLLRELVERVLHLLALAFLAKVIEDELLVDVHVRAVPAARRL